MSVSLNGDKWPLAVSADRPSEGQATGALTSPLGAVAGPAAVPGVGVEHGDVAALALQVHVLLQLQQGLVRAHVGVGEL